LSDRFVSSEQIATFGEVQFDVTEQLQMTLGLRHYEDDHVTIERAEASIAGLASVGLNNEWTEGFSKTTWRVNLGWAPDVDSLYYVNIAQGFRPGAANPADARINSAVNPAVDLPNYTNAETVTSYELGLKNTFLEGRLAIEATIYYLDWEDFIASLQTLNPAGAPVSARVNGGDVSGIGLDLGISYQATDALLLSISGNVNETEYQDDVMAAGVSAGDQLSLAQTFNVNASATYTWNMGNDRTGTFRMAYKYVDERTDYEPCCPTYTSDSISTLNARVGIESNRWSAYLTGENLTDENGAVSQIAGVAGRGSPPNRLRPLTVGVQATLNF